MNVIRTSEVSANDTDEDKEERGHTRYNKTAAKIERTM